MPSLPIPVPLAVAIFVTIWFTLLFAILPIGVRSQAESGEVVPGSEPGAPVAPRLLFKAALTTGVSIVAFVVLVLVFRVAG
jgi:predicted secreted protein